MFMSSFLIPKGILKKPDYYISRFFSNVMNIRRNIGLLGGTLMQSKVYWGSRDFELGKISAF